MNSPEIENAVAENRDLTDLEKLSFGLSEMALHVRYWLKYTKEVREREGLDCGYYADITFPKRPSYPQFEVWAETMEKSAEAIRRIPPADAGS